MDDKSSTSSTKEAQVFGLKPWFINGFNSYPNHHCLFFICCTCLNIHTALIILTFYGSGITLLFNNFNYIFLFTLPADAFV